MSRARLRRLTPDRVFDLLAKDLGHDNFAVTTGFIDRWKTRHLIGMKKISGEENSVPEEAIEPWISSILPDLLKKYKPEDVYNADETGLFYKLQPDRTLAFKGVLERRNRKIASPS